MCCVCMQMRCVRTCWCADTDDCKKNKRKRKERKGNLLNTNLDKQICVACECRCVACGHVGEDADGCKKKRKEDGKEKRKEKKTYQIQILAHRCVSGYVACACGCGWMRMVWMRMVVEENE